MVNSTRVQLPKIHISSMQKLKWNEMKQVSGQCVVGIKWLHRSDRCFNNASAKEAISIFHFGQNKLEPFLFLHICAQAFMHYLNRVEKKIAGTTLELFLLN